MEMDKAFLLQKQVKNYTEDLQKEFRDMTAWEEQMKKKDLEIRCSKDTHVIPPVRRKKKKKTIAPLEETKDEKPSKTKRISGSDYKSWDKFNADEACKEIDEKDHWEKKEEKEFEIPSKEELEKEHAEAIKFKQEGNILVQKQEYAKAVGKYSEAIKIFPYDAVFFANRALCQLKLDNLYSAESDCTAAIERDSKYVKAYHRRATVRLEFKHYEDALKDIETVIQLDPSNKEAKCLLTQVQKKIDKLPKPMVISGEKNQEKSSIEQKIGKKLFGKKVNVPLQDKNIKPENDLDDMSINVEHTEIKKEPIIKKAESPEDEDAGLPAWLPTLKDDISIIEPLLEPPPRSKQRLKRITVNEASINESIFKGIEKASEQNEKPIIAEQRLQENQNKTVSEEKLNNIVSEEKLNNIVSEEKLNNIESSKENTEEIECIPPSPKSSVAFILNWRKNISHNFRYKYLKQIPPKDLPDIFKESMEANIFSEILSILNKAFITNCDQVYEFLYHFTKLKRFRALTLFMSKEDKETLKCLFEYCRNEENKNEEEIQNLRSLYEM